MKLISIIPMLSVLSLFKHSFSMQSTKLRFVQIIFRHGDRAPEKLYKNDPNPPSAWPQGLGELSLLGKKQHYNLGKYLHKRYENFTSFSPLEIHATSSHVNRCLMSAQANLATFFAPSANWTFEQNLQWQPIPVSYIPKAKDKYLEVKSDCPRADEVRKKSSIKEKQFTKEYEEMFSTLSRVSGENISNGFNASVLRDTIGIEKKYGLKVPPGLPCWEKLINMSSWSYFFSFDSPVLHRLRGGPLIKKIIKIMNKSIAGKFKNRKFEVYYTHDSVMVALMSALKLYEFRLVPYAASLLFELHEMPSKEKAVRILYLNSTRPEVKIEEPYTLVLKGCKEFCPFKSFVKITKGLIPKDWKKECQLDKRSSTKSQ